MRELELSGLHDDGDHVVLTDSDGERYTLLIDDALRAAVRRDRPLLGTIQADERTPVRPREIQSMLRSGLDAEEIAASSGLPVDHIRRYEGPVLAERAFIAERARNFHVGRGGGPTLNDVVEDRLLTRQADPEQTWDAWRRPDGTWTLHMVFTAAGRSRSAEWVADMTRQSVVPADDEARWLTDDEDEEPPRGRPRLSAVKSWVYDVEADGGVTEQPQHLPLRRIPPRHYGHPAARSGQIDEATLDALNARRGIRAVPNNSAPSASESSNTPSPAEDNGRWPRSSLHPGADTNSTTEPLFDNGQLPDTTGTVRPLWESLDVAQTPAKVLAPNSQPAMPSSVTPNSASSAASPASGESARTSPLSVSPVRPLEHPHSTTATTGDNSQTHQSAHSSATSESSPSSANSQSQDTSSKAPDKTVLPPEMDPAAQKDAKGPAKKTKGQGRSKRSSVPSWDEIVFGPRGG
ncbi:septation protein SepH [Devriesea agamarum]|uniref:septation protein SepH n=1 Tax=Devriesea agamarum TaxID=472569 RepID=UPI00071C9E29|nr:septation protein SepH [Devriesea agamarum]